MAKSCGASQPGADRFSYPSMDAELATFTDREEAVNSRHWRDLKTKYLKDV